MVQNRARIGSLFVLLFSTGFVFAETVQPGPARAASSWLPDWSLQPGVIALLVMFALLYARGWALMNRRHTWPTRRLRIQAFFFSGGMAAIVVTMISPLRALATEQQWAHMLQHAMLVLVSAPLLVLANPLPALLLGLPAPARRGLGEGWCCVTRLRPAWDLLSSPPAAPLLLAVVLFAWHTPGLYQAALADEGLHVLQHLSLLGAGILFWWMILRRPRAHRVSHKFVLQ